MQKKFGLGSTSGIEIPEAQPQISDDSSVPSAIGQGTNNYTTSQLARYITTVANKGTVYNLTVLDKVTNVRGKIIKSYKAKVKNKITVFRIPPGVQYTQVCVMWYFWNIMIFSRV